MSDRSKRFTTGRKDGSELFAVCAGFKSGKVIHDVKVFGVAAPQTAYDGYNTHATPTPIVEESRIYVRLAAYGTACLDTRTGDKVWERRDLKADHRVRPASSPIIDSERLFLVFDGTDAQFIVALDKKTGAGIWKERLGCGNSHWASPLSAKGKVYCGTTSAVPKSWRSLATWFTESCRRPSHPSVRRLMW